MKHDTNIIKIFISYSWKPTANKIKVMNLAERLTNDGIHVIIDDWDLKEGQDKYHFMEQMVNDDTVSKVLLICNKEYSEKANKKLGGVGIESLIISNEIYDSVDQTKFIPIVMEYEQPGKPYVPTFVKTRIFIDLSDDNEYEENYEKLIRNIYNKPTSKRPPIGKMPVHISDDNPIFLPTAHKVSVIKNALINGNSNSELLITDYFETFIGALSSFKIDILILNNQNFIEEIERSINSMQPLKNDFLEFLYIYCKFSSTDYQEIFFSFFENLLQFYEDNDIKLTSDTSLQNLKNDNFRYFTYDLFLSVVAILLEKEKFSLLAYLVKNNFVVVRTYNSKAEATNFVEFRPYNYTLNEFKNQSYNPKRVSIVADTVKANASIVKFDNLKTADIILYYLSLFYPRKSMFSEWFPETSCYYSYGDLLPKLISKRYFEKIKIIFDVNTVENFKAKVEELSKKDSIQRGYYRIPNIASGLNYKDVGSIT